MSAQERAIEPACFAELLNLFACPAWIEDSSGKILARNTRPCLTRDRHLVKTESYSLPCSLPPAGDTGDLRLVARFPAGQEADCRRRVISALLAKILQARQSAAVDESLLTPRQREIYRELACGCSYKEIAARLGISHNNVLVQANRMRKTLGADFFPYQRKKRRRLVN